MIPALPCPSHTYPHAFLSSFLVNQNQNHFLNIYCVYYLTTTGLDAAERKFGQGKVDPAKERGVNEKVTDQARGMFEKMTG